MKSKKLKHFKELSLLLQVPSMMQKRTVGFEHPYTHQLVWFNLEKGPLHFVPDIGLYFKMQVVGDQAHGDAHHATAAHH